MGYSLESILVPPAATTSCRLNFPSCLHRSGGCEDHLVRLAARLGHLDAAHWRLRTSSWWRSARTSACSCARPQQRSNRSQESKKGRARHRRHVDPARRKHQSFVRRKAWKRRKTYGSVSLKRLSGPAGKARPGKVGHHPVASLAWSGATPAAKRRQRVRGPCDRASKRCLWREPTRRRGRQQRSVRVAGRRGLAAVSFPFRWTV